MKDPAFEGGPNESDRQQHAPLRLLVLSGTSEVGGTERFVLGVVERLDRRHFTPAICVVETPGGLADDYRRAADAVWHLNWSAANIVRVVSAWRAVLSEWRPDVVMLCGFRANMLGRFMSGGAPVVNALRSVVLDDTGRPLAHWLDRVTFNRVAVCVSNSQAGIERHIEAGFPADKFEWIPNGVDLERFGGPHREGERARYGIGRDELVVLAVANLRPVKNLPLLLNASRRLFDRGLAHRVWIAGEGSERCALESLARDLRLGDVVEFLGAAADLAQRYAAADVFTLTSHFEGMPTVVLEAFAAGLPVVATAVGDVPILCKETGILVPPDDLDALIEALRRVLVDRELRATLRASARKAATQFSIVEMTAKYDELLTRTARSARRPR